MGKFISEFKVFAVKGNAVDMAIGIIIGAAFGKIVSSIVDDIIMPPIGWLIKGVNFSDLKFKLPSVYIPGMEKIPSVTINYGHFLQALLNFIIVAFCVFLIVKTINRITNNNKDKKPAAPSKEEQLLSEIRDLLKEKQNTDKNN
ncbi:large-conductance mechanosensitive channel protein MscL [Segatella paludivivens]|uniref:large-conductance mechanosensitive channel protein MscL n=1 Tax=Segatella paludivivens TaxID=185294 RepID=UPI000364DB81|nr:large-conductance mechanosensitive channel protein MscL [Segatella paludivivens]